MKKLLCESIVYCNFLSILLLIVGLTSCFGLLTDSAVVVSALVVSALGKSGLNMDVPALSYMYAAYGKSGLISNGKE